MNKINDSYKIFQLVRLFVTKYGFSQYVIKQYQLFIQEEAWLTNYKDKHYQVIHIVLGDKERDTESHARYMNYRKALAQEYGKEAKILQVYIANHDYQKIENCDDYCYVEDNFYSGIDLKNVYPELYNCVENSDNPALDFDKNVRLIDKEIKKRRRHLPLYLRQKMLYTYIIMGLCCLMFIIQTILEYRTDEASSYLLLGADYKTLTLGCQEFYRLITYAFLHGSLVHVFCNLVSLFSIGRILEPALGHKNYLIILFVSILTGSLTHGILTDNELCIGLSGGIYGLFVVYLIFMFKNKFINIKELIPMVLLNIMLNFMSTTAWTCHLGGAIGGFIAYYAFDNSKNYGGIALLVILILCLIYKYATISTITTLYGGTDTAYVQVIEDLGFDSTNLVNKLIAAYTKYGG